MLQLIETICYEHGSFQRLSLHENRLNGSRVQLFGLTDRLTLQPYLRIPEHLKDKKVKCRVTYSHKIEDIEYEQYIPKIVKSLKLVFDDHIDYSHKYKNRESLDRLADLRGNSDEILIVKNGMVTDTSYSNILFLKAGIWYTPALPLLHGTQRAEYIQKKLIIPSPIGVAEIAMYEQVKLINSLLSIATTEPINIEAIGK